MPLPQRTEPSEFSFRTRHRVLAETGIAPGTLRRLVREGKVRARRVGRDTVVSVADLEREVGFTDAAEPEPAEAIDSDVLAVVRRMHP